MTTSEAPARRSFGERLMGAIKLDAATYAEIEHDPNAMGQAAAVVALASLATGLAGIGETGAIGPIAAVVGGLIGWVLSTAVVWLIGVKFMQHTSDYQELLRTLGFASAPRLIGILGIVPMLGFLALLAAGILGLIAYVVAVREALDVSTGRAVVVCVLAYVLVIAATMAIIGIAGVGSAPMPAA